MLPKTLCLLAASITLGSATPAFADAAKPIRIGASFQEINNPYFVTMKNALEEAGAASTRPRVLSRSPKPG